jgi:L-aspartate oxidase
MKNYDCIIVGSGIAGLYISHLIKGHVLILTKDSIKDCNTEHAQGGIAAPTGKGDSADLHFSDTIAAGAGLCDAKAVRILVEEAMDRIKDLIRMGVPFDTADGDVSLTREGGHSLPRILHAGGDATGKYIEGALSEGIPNNVEVLEHCFVTDAIVREGKVRGVRTQDSTFGCRFLVLAMGGAGQLFSFTTNPETATGDGVALAFRAGAEVTDMEFFQFHPTALRLPEAPTFLISEAVRGEGGILRNVNGDRFMMKYSKDGELAQRDVVTRSILTEMRETKSDHVFLDVTHLPSHFISKRFPNIYHFCAEHGLNIAESPMPVAPAAHYMMGGVKVNEWGETNITGLFACGETSCTGVHGANRLASNSLLEAIVFGKRIAERMEKDGKDGTKTTECAVHLKDRNESRTVPFNISALQSLMWDRVGMIRNGHGLEIAAVTLASWQKQRASPLNRRACELNNMLLVGRLMTEAALVREESRGAHFRSDFPKPSKEWERHIVFRKM